MTKSINDKPREREHLFTGYGGQVLVAPLLAGILLCIFFWFFGYDVNLLLTNAGILAIWLILVLFAFLRRPHGEVWRNYRWIIAPAILILLFLFNTSWAQSTLATSSLKKSVFKATSLDSLQFHAEYPSQILFDDTELSEIRLWVTGLPNCTNLTISGQGLVFAAKPTSDDSSIKWGDTLNIHFEKETNATTLLLQPSKSPEFDSRSIQLKLDSNSKSLETKDWLVIVESKHDSQVRNWKKNFLAASSTIVSLITAIFVGIKQLEERQEEEKKRQEEEKKRQKTKQMYQAIASFDDDLASNLSGALNKHLDLTTDWNEWDKALQEQFCKKYSSLAEGKLWDILANLPLSEIPDLVGSCLQVCGRIFDGTKENLISTLENLQSALQQDEGAPLALLTLLKEYPASIDLIRQITYDLRLELILKMVGEYIDKFPKQISDLKILSDTESFPLQRQFAYFAKAHISEDRLTAWLKTHEMDFSPFADAESPFYSVLDGQLPIELALPGFSFLTSAHQNLIFEFANSWDAGAALFAYCQSLKSEVKIKDGTFFASLASNLIENHGADHSRKAYLHALAEQWTWSLAETPTLFYSLRGQQRDLIGRLLRWHDFSPSVTAYKIAQFANPLPDEEKKNQTALLSKMTEWLTDKDAVDLRTEEVNALIELRPSSKQKTLFLISATDLDPRVKKQTPPDLLKKFTEQSDWLSSHNCGFVCFSVDAQSRQIVSDSSLVNQCNIRVQWCSKNLLQGFDELFIPHIEKSAQDLLAQKAAGSPGKMVRLGQKLLLQHVEKYSSDELLHIEDLIALE